MKLAAITQKTTKTSMPFDDDVLNYEFKHALITPALVADIQRLIEASVSAENILAISTHIVSLVTTWDLIDEDGAMFPLDAKRIAHEVPLVFQATLITDMISKMRQGEANAPGA